MAMDSCSIQKQNKNLAAGSARWNEELRTYATRCHVQTKNVPIQKCCFHFQRFDSDPERQLAVLVDSGVEKTVHRWMKPAENQFQIEYETGRRYNPDFVVETDNEILIIEVKAKNEMSDSNVLAKARAARRWVYFANELAKDM